MIVALGWLAIGIALWLGQAAASVVAWLGGWDEVAILATLTAMAAGQGLWVIRYGGIYDKQGGGE